MIVNTTKGPYFVDKLTVAAASSMARTNRSLWLERASRRKAELGRKKCRVERGRLAPVPSLRFCRPLERQLLHHGQMGLTPLRTPLRSALLVLLRDSPIIFFKSEDHSAPRSKADDSVLGGGTG
jgi:hypothetical protein